MLVLTRKPQQQIQIGEDITITILHVKGQAVRVGIAAPRKVRVLRPEVVHRAAPAKSSQEGASSPAGIAAAEQLVQSAPIAEAAPETANKPIHAKTLIDSWETRRPWTPGAARVAPLIRPAPRLGPTTLRSLVAMRHR